MVPASATINIEVNSRFCHETFNPSDTHTVQGAHRPVQLLMWLGTVLCTLRVCSVVLITFTVKDCHISCFSDGPFLMKYVAVGHENESEIWHGVDLESYLTSLVMVGHVIRSKITLPFLLLLNLLFDLVIHQELAH